MSTPRRLLCSRKRWTVITGELHRRTEGTREAGAFLLGRHTWFGSARILLPIYYDDIDPHCFDDGYVRFNGARLGEVWRECRERRMTVVADVHVHPGGYGQSKSDRRNPMMTHAGHYALILPHFARGPCLPGTIGVYEHLGARSWADHSKALPQRLRIGGVLWNW